MPRLRVIILDKQQGNRYRYAMWADVPAARQSFYANAGITSAWRGATPTDNTNLQSGAVLELVDVISVDAGATLAQIEQGLQDVWNAYQASVTAANPWIRYGSTWDGTTWAITGVA